MDAKQSRVIKLCKVEFWLVQLILNTRNIHSLIMQKPSFTAKQTQTGTITHSSTVAITMQIQKDCLLNNTPKEPRLRFLCLNLYFSAVCTKYTRQFRTGHEQFISEPVMRSQLSENQGNRIINKHEPYVCAYMHLCACVCMYDHHSS